MRSAFLVAYISILSPLFALGLSFRLRKVSYEIRLIQLLTASAFAMDVASYLMGRQRLNTFPIGNLYLLIQSVLLLFIYRDALKIKKFSIHFIVAYTLGFLVNYFYIQNPFIH